MMYDFKNLNSAIKKNKDYGDKRADKSKVLIDKAFDYLNKFNSLNGSNKKYLEEAAKNLLEGIKLKKDNPFAYLALTYIFYLQGKDSLALKYFKIAKDINPDIPSVQNFENLICKVENKSTLINKIIVEDNIPDKLPETIIKPEPQAKKIQRIARINRISKS